MSFTTVSLFLAPNRGEGGGYYRKKIVIYVCRWKWSVALVRQSPEVDK